MYISIESAQATLQKYFVVCAGVPCDTVLAPQLAARVVVEGHWGAVEEVVNGYLGAQAAVLGAAALVARMADEGFGVHLSAAEAQGYAARVTSGEMSWAGLVGWALTLEGPEGQTLANRAQVAQMFTNTLRAANKGDLWSVDGIRGAAQTLLHRVTADPATAEHACECLTTLVANMTMAGVQAKAGDGYLAGATVFVDANANGILDLGEFATTSDGSGNFSIPLDAPDGRLIAFGGIDLLTGEPFHGRLFAPAGAAVITPFTTLVSALIDGGFVESAQEGADLARAVLQLPEGVNLMTYDAIALLATRQQVDEALAVQTIAVQVSNFLNNAAIALYGALGMTGPRAFDLAAAALAAALGDAATFDLTLNLTSPQVLSGLLTDAAEAYLGAPPDAVLAGVIAQVGQAIAAQNAAAQWAESIFDLSKASVVSLAQLPDALMDAFLVGSDLQALLSQFTGANLTARIAAAQPGELLPGLQVREAQTYALKFGGTMDDGAPEVQAIALYAHTPGAQYELTVGGTVLVTAPLAAAATAADVAAALRSAPGYGAAPFVVEATGGVLRLTWKTVGDQTVTAELKSVLVGAAVQDPDPQDGVAGAPEVQRIAAGELTAGARYMLSAGSTVLAAAALDDSPTTEELAAALQADASYAGAPFTVAASGTDLVLTWKSEGDQPDVAALQAVVIGEAATDPDPEDGTGTPEVQSIAAGALIGGAQYQLTVGATMLATGPLDADPTGGELAAALQAASGYAAADFTLAAVGDDLVVTWKTLGDQADVAELRSIVTSGAATDPAPLDGTPGSVEVQAIPLADALTAGAVYRLNAGGTELTAAALDADPTVSELAAALRATSGYADAPIMVAAEGNDLVVTWKEPGDQDELAQLSSIIASPPVLSTPVSDGKGKGMHEHEVQSFDASSLAAGEAYMLTVHMADTTHGGEHETDGETDHEGGHTSDDGSSHTTDGGTEHESDHETDGGTDHGTDGGAAGGTALTVVTQQLDGTPTLPELIAAFQAADGYYLLPVDLSASGTDLVLTWKKGSDQPDGAAELHHILSTEIATAATTIDGTGSREVQAIAADALVAGARYQLSVGATSLMTAALDGDPTAAELAAALRTDPAYAAAAFTLSTSGTDLVVTWKAVGDQQDIAGLRSIVTSPPATDADPADGVAGTPEVQAIDAGAPTLVAGAHYLLDVGAASLLTAALDGSPTTGELVAALQAAPGYAAAPFAVGQSGQGVVVTWKTGGDQTDIAELRSVVAAGPVLNDADPQDGVAGSAEVQSLAAAAPFAGAQYKLTVGGTTLTTAALDADPTTAELVAALRVATGYEAAPFTVAASGTELQVTWKVAGDQDVLAELRAVVQCAAGSSWVATDGTDDGSAVSESPAWAPRVIEGMMPGDGIDLLTPTGWALPAPVSLTRVADVGSSGNLLWSFMLAFADLGPNEAGLVVVNGGTAAGTYLYADDGDGGFDWSEDLLVELVGVTTGPVGPLNVADYFA